MKFSLAVLVLLCLAVLVMSKSTSKHSTKAVKKAPVEDKSREEEKPKEKNDEINDRVEGGVGTGETRPTHDDEAEADAAANAKPVPTKPPTGAKPGEIEE